MLDVSPLVANHYCVFAKTWRQSANTFNPYTIQGIKKSAGSGPDHIPALFIYNCSHYLIDPILNLFNSFLSTGVFPKILKSCYIRPLQKKGNNKNYVQNYRPIATNSALSKIFDSIITGKLSVFLLPPVSIKQHGFLPNRFTETNLASFTDFIFKYSIPSLNFAKLMHFSVIFLKRWTQ